MELKTTEAVIDAFGGIAAFCQLLNYKPGQVSTWNWRHEFAYHARPRIGRAAEQLGIEISDELLGLNVFATGAHEPAN